jgi:sigma-B regulation protein RsbU (phosphoserine phosphatase)
MEVWGGSQLTSNTVELGGLEAWVYSKPYGQAQRGGDVYYASSCATGRISRLLLADVSGHGKTVAATAADLRTLMRRFVNRLDQKEFVRLLNQQFTALSRNGIFATAVVTTFFSPSRRLSVCNAGHPRPLLYRAVDRGWSFLGHEETAKNGPQTANIPLGIIHLADYDQFDVELDPGDCLLSYTDALIESCDADGEMLGEDGLLRIINLLGDVEPQKLIDTLTLFCLANEFTELQSQCARQRMCNLNSHADLAEFYGANVGAVNVRPLCKFLLRESQSLPLLADGMSECVTGESGCLRHTSLLLF